jgi:hypothetical protein
VEQQSLLTMTVERDQPGNRTREGLRRHPAHLTISHTRRRIAPSSSARYTGTHPDQQ